MNQNRPEAWRSRGSPDKGKGQKFPASPRRADPRSAESGQAHTISRLAGGIAHDFNNLLTAIKGHLEFAKSRVHGDTELAENLSVALDCSDRAGALSRRLLAFSRDQFVTPKAVAIQPLLEQITVFLGRLMPPHVDVVLEAGDAGSNVLGDAGQIEQAITNLALNARDAMPNGGTLTVRATQQFATDAFRAAHPWVRPGRYVRIDVVDTGVGIPVELQAHLFEPFFTSKSEGKGTGLGLSIVYGIAKQHRGFVGVQSRPGEGSTFWLLLPLGTDRQGAASVAAPAEDRTSDGAVGDHTILVVEDEEIVRDLATLTLRSQGYRVFPARSAEEAERIFRIAPQEIDLLLTDLVLSGANGRQLAARLSERKPGLKVILTSGYDTEHALSGAPSDPGCVFLGKPYSLRALTDLVGKLIHE